MLKVGTKIKYRGRFGLEKPTIVTITNIERSKYKRDKHDGVNVDSIPFNKREYAVFDLDDGHWCYGEQIDEIVE